MSYNPSRMRFRVLVHVERRRLREEIIEFAYVLGRNPSEENIARLDLMWELEARLTRLLDLYNEWDGASYRPFHGHSQSTIADATDIYLQGRKHTVRLGKIVSTLRDAGLLGSPGGLLNDQVVRKALKEDRRFDHSGKKGWIVATDAVQDNAAIH